MSRRSLMAGTVFGAAASWGVSSQFSKEKGVAVTDLTEPDFEHRNTPPAQVPVTGAAADAFAVVTDPRFAGGADATGKRDSSDSFRAAVTSELPVFVPSGQYRYSGPGLDGAALNIVGAGQGETTISLDANTYFVDSNQAWSRFRLSGIRFNGGGGHVRNRYRGTSVADMSIISDCAFIDYSACSISNNSSDQPYWKIQRNIFKADNYRTSIGIALSGLSDGSTIEDNEFLANRVHFKTRQGGNNTYIQRNDFLRFGPSEGSPRIDVWVVPAREDVNAGSGFVLARCKFGNENLAPDDLRVVYADEAPGESNGEIFPVLDKISRGWVMGHTIAQVLTNGIGDQHPIPLVHSMTPQILGGVYGPVTQGGSKGAPILSVPRPFEFKESNVFGPYVRATSDTGSLPDMVEVRG